MPGIRTHITKAWTMECCHRLANVPEGHKSGQAHGHTYRVAVELSGTAFSEEGWLVDSADVKGCIYDRFDHRDLNEVLQGNGVHLDPTAEALCHIFWDIIETEVLRPANLGQEAHDWVRIERLSVQEGDQGIAEIRRD